MDEPPDVTWVGPLAGCGGWLGTEMDPPGFWVVELLPGELPPGELLLGLLLLLLGELLLPVVLLGELVAAAG